MRFLVALLLVALLPCVASAQPGEGAGPVAPQVWLDVRVVTVYHATAAQTDDNPLVTADGTRVTSDSRICALSRELLERWGGPVRYGDAVWVDVPDRELAGFWFVHDTMAADVSGYVDLLVPEGVLECWHDGPVRVAGGCVQAEIDVTLVRW